jgi:hypothetical protein
MLVRLGASDVVLVRVGAAQHARALPSGQGSQPEPEPGRLHEPAYVHDTRASVLRLQRACEAYRASELIQPRAGLFLRIKA